MPPEVIDEPTTPEAQLEAPPEEANYRDGNADSFCGKCSHFNDGVCELWNAYVEPDGLSDGFEAGRHPEADHPDDLPRDPEALTDDAKTDLDLAIVTPSRAKRVGGSFNPSKHLRDPRTGKFLNMPDLLRNVDGKGAVDISFIASGTPRIRGVVVAPGLTKREVTVTMGLRLGAQTGVVSFLVARRLLSIDLLEHLVERINVGSKLKSFTSLGVKKFTRGSYYNFYNWYSRQVGKAVPGLSEDGYMNPKRFELFLGEDATVEVDEDGLVWKMALPVGELALSPGYNGKPVEMPLRVVEGKSSDPKYAIGLQDLVEAFEAGAVQHVTVPKTHADRVDENTGFVRKVRIGEGVVKGQKVKGLLTGIEFTEPEVKGKVQRGTIANVSVGVDFDYRKKDTGTTFPAVLQHVALTNKPWVPGMQPFGIAASEDGVEPDVKPEDIVPIVLVDAEESWDNADTYTKKRDRIQAALDRLGDETELIDFDAHRLFVRNPVTGTKWIANYNDFEGSVDVYDPETWISSEAPSEGDAEEEPPAPAPDPKPEEEQPEEVQPREPVSQPHAVAASEPKSPLEEAQMGRRLRMSESTRTPQKGGVHMSDTKKIEDMSVEELRAYALSERTAREAAEAKARATAHREAVDARITELSEKSGLGDHPGFLRVLRQVMLADDGGPAGIVLSEDGRTKSEVTLSEAIDLVIDALPRDKEGKIALSTQQHDTGAKKPKETHTADDPNTPEAIEARVKAAEERLAAR